MRLCIILLVFHIYCSDLFPQKPLDTSIFPCQVLPPTTERGYLQYTDQLTLWKSQVVPLGFSESFPLANREPVLKAISTIQENTNLCFVPRRNETSWIRFSPYFGIASFAVIEDNTVLLSSVDSITIIHEICHLLGMAHEHQRPDRGEHIAVHYQNIIPAYAYAFDIIPAAPEALLSDPYDVKSIMHYPSTAFSSNGASTITDIGWNPISQNTVLSEGDIRFLREVYPQKMNCQEAEQKRPPRAILVSDNEEDNCSFSLYSLRHSSLGAGSIEWSAPGAVPASGSDSLFTFYFPNAGEFSVTLKAVNAYGSDEQTVVFKVKDCVESKIESLKPNPASDYLEFTLSRILPADFTIRILLPDGREVFRQHGVPANLGDYSYVLHLPDLIQGSYVLVLDAYGTLLSKPFVVKK